MSPLSSFLVPGARVGVVGSRDFPVPSLVESFVVGLDGCVVVSGGNGAVDIAAAAAGRFAGLEVIEYLPLWGRYRKGAGPERNSRLVGGGLDVLVVFLSSPGRPSPGSSDCARKARAAGIPVFCFGPDGAAF